LEDAKAEQELIKKARAGKLVEKKEKVVPSKGNNLRKFNVFVDDEYFEVGVEEVGGSPIVSYVQQAQSQIPAQQPVTVAPSPQGLPAAPQPQVPAAHVEQPAVPAKSTTTASKKAESDTEGTPLKAPMPGIIVSYKKQVGDSVNTGETVVILEAMKMENALPSPAGGTIKSINFASGDTVARNDVLCVIT
jgi:oxaloacetate decarboxylase alpha subunit/pyruvate carboxylase subunit B